MSEHSSKMHGFLYKTMGKVQETIGKVTRDEDLMKKGEEMSKQGEVEIKASKAEHDASDKTGPMMRAVEWHGNQDLRVVQRPRHKLKEPGDAIVRVTCTTICGSDMNIYHNRVPVGQMAKAGDVIGHEFMGIIEEVGNRVENVRVGDRVVVSAIIACGACRFCRKKQFSLCDTTNPSKSMEKVYGHNIAAVFGFTRLTGGFQGGQAEYVRVPFADVNCLQVPSELKDEQVLFLSDIVCTGWHGNELAKVKVSDVVAVWGCGPVGLMAMQWAKLRGAGRIIAIDNVPYRLNFAREKYGAATINFDEQNVITALEKMVPGGVDKCIDCAGYRSSPKGTLHKIQATLKVETDPLDIVDEMVRSCRKGGRIALIDDYFGYGNLFPIGAYMEKGQIMRGSQVFVQKYWHDLLGYIQRGEFDPTSVITHRMKLEDLPKAYKMFDLKEDGVLKILIEVTHGESTSTSSSSTSSCGPGGEIQQREEESKFGKLD